MKSRHWRRTLCEAQPNRDGAIELLQPIEHLFTEMLNRETANLPRQPLQGLNCQAVIQACAQIICHCRCTEIQLKLDVQAKPLAISTFLLKHTHMRPQF
jgi:hypothetical protein